MCGFIGALDADLTIEALASSARLLAHRGPDGTASVERGPLKLIAHRLAIVPPSDASAIVVRGGSVLALNGEIYGLECANCGLPRTDAELLSEWLGTGGESRLGSLRGLFAFCEFDGERLLLARDRFGIKPLYYVRRGRGLAFASEMKPLLALPGVSREPDVDVLASFEVIGHNVFVGRTPFRAIHALRPGHVLRLVPGSEPEDRTFARVPPVPLAGEGLFCDVEELAGNVEALLDAAVSRAMHHDPLHKALFFSGGLDSTLLLDLARQHGTVSAHVLSDREEADDLLEARKVAAALDVALYEHRVSPDDLDRELVQYAWHFERPIAGGTFDLLGGVAFHALARRMARDSRVAFCGEGADELFLGYHRLHMEPALVQSDLAARAHRRATAALREWLEERFSTISAGTDAAARELRDLALHQGLFEYHLPSVDRSGMAFGMEVRPPYLDEDLVDFVAALDESVLVDREGRWTKVPLRHIARRRLTRPELARVAVRRKRAMPTAVERSGAELAASVDALVPGFGLEPLLWRLFWYLHIEPGLINPPAFTLTEFAAGPGRCPSGGAEP